MAGCARVPSVVVAIFVVSSFCSLCLVYLPFVCSRPWSCRSERRVNNSVCSCHCCYTHIYPYWAMWTYRRVTLSDVSGKLFSTIINRRLQMWVDMNNTIGEQQAGFRKDYSTVDHIFTLLAIVQKQLSLNRKLYVAFIDFEKAFDSISRKLLWPFLQKARYSW